MSQLKLWTKVRVIRMGQPTLPSTDKSKNCALNPTHSCENNHGVYDDDELIWTK